MPPVAAPGLLPPLPLRPLRPLTESWTVLLLILPSNSLMAMALGSGARVLVVPAVLATAVCPQEPPVCVGPRACARTDRLKR